MIFLKLILAHLLGDFIFQPTSWVLHKEQNKGKSKFLYLHVFLHSILVLLLLFDLSLWWVAALVGISHLIIDLLKLYFQKGKTKRNWFFIDQALHFSVIIALASYFKEIDFTFFENPELLKYFTAAVFLSIPVSYIIKILLSTWSPINIYQNNTQIESLVNAGQYIGILERILVFVFISVNHWEGVGFMIAAKSVFRFSDLAEAKQRKLTEYVLIGTLLSFGIAILMGVLVKL